MLLSPPLAASSPWTETIAKALRRHLMAIMEGVFVGFLLPSPPVELHCNHHVRAIAVEAIAFRYDMRREGGSLSLSAVFG